VNERVPLSFLLAENSTKQPPVEPIVPFPALYMEDPRICTAVLERTAVLASTTDQYERITARLDQVLVDPAMVEWRTKTADYEGIRTDPAAAKKPGAQYRRYAHRDNESVRAASDQRALEKRQQIQKSEETEMRLLRQRSSQKPAATKEELVNTVVESTTTNPSANTTVALSVTRLKHCKRCGEDKPASEFAATGIYGGYCSTCEPIEKAERAAARGLNPAPTMKRRSSKRAPKATQAPVASSNGISATPYANVVKLLQKRDALKAELANVQEQLREALV